MKRLTTLAKRDHPRACGENVQIDLPTLMLDGITPAHAGKTISKALLTYGYKDHPRACGEN